MPLEPLLNLQPDIEELDIIENFASALKPNPYKNSFNIAFLGLGPLALQSLPLICTKLGHLLHRVYLFSRNEEKSRASAQLIARESRINTNIDYIPCIANSLEEHIQDIDILIQSLSQKIILMQA
ncbi:hypothetical protein HZB88_02820 [archaeon]|nr:hypothetical protein [archaeon]